MRNIWIFFFSAILLFLFIFSVSVNAQNNWVPDEFFVAEVKLVEPAGEEIVMGATRKLQTIELVIIKGDRKGEVVVFTEEDRFTVAPKDRIESGDRVVVRQSQTMNGEALYNVEDSYRLASLAWIFLIFFVLAIIFGGKRGFGAVVGLGFSVLVLAYFIIPRLLEGANPFVTTIIGASLIMVVSLFLAHGFSTRICVAMVSVFITLIFAIGFAYLFICLTHLMGFGSEGVFHLQGSFGLSLDFRGLLLSGIIIGMLGVLDDVTTTQAATIDELKKANPALGFGELYTHAISVGKEHIASMVNTLVLAYAGAALPLFLVLAANQEKPLWLMINSEFLAEEIIRMLAGSVALILAVPITTVIASWWFGRNPGIDK